MGKLLVTAKVTEHCISVKGPNYLCHVSAIDIIS